MSLPTDDELLPVLIKCDDCYFSVPEATLKNESTFFKDLLSKNDPKRYFVNTSLENVLSSDNINTN